MKFGSVRIVRPRYRIRSVALPMNRTSSVALDPSAALVVERPSWLVMRPSLVVGRTVAAASCATPGSERSAGCGGLTGTDWPAGAPNQRLSGRRRRLEPQHELGD